MITPILLAIVNWPAIALLLEWVDDPRASWILYNSAANAAHLLFWLIGDFINSRFEDNHKYFDIYVLSLGPFVFLSSFLCSGYLFSMYLANETLLVGKAAYTLSFSAIFNLIVLISVILAIVPVTRMLFSSSVVRRCVYAGVMLITIASFWILVQMNLRMKDPADEECMQVKDFWYKMAIKYILLIGISVLVAGMVLRPQRFARSARMSGLILLALFFMVGSYLFLDGIALLKNGSFAKCNTHLVTAALQFTVEGWLAAPGMIGAIGLVFHMLMTLVGQLCYLIMRLVCPGFLQSTYMALFNQQQDDVISNDIEMPLIRLESRNFDPQNHSASFRETGVCVICLEPFTENERVVYWQGCNHVFHKACIEKWTAGHHNTCPTCKRPAQEEQQPLPQEHEILSRSSQRQPYVSVDVGNI